MPIKLLPNLLEHRNPSTNVPFDREVIELKKVKAVVSKKFYYQQVLTITLYFAAYVDQVCREKKISIGQDGPPFLAAANFISNLFEMECFVDTLNHLKIDVRDAQQLEQNGIPVEIINHI